LKIMITQIYSITGKNIGLNIGKNKIRTIARGFAH